MQLPNLKIGELTVSLPIVQGGMGVGISGSGLAAAVANEGGIGVISGVQIGYKEKDFKENNIEANIRALKKEILRAKKLSPKGILGVNLLVAMNSYKEMVTAAIQEGINIIFSGAGLPKDLPMLIKGSSTKIAPIISSSKAALVITKLWDKRYKYLPDLIVIEGSKAGGHLGFKKEELLENTTKNLKEIVGEVLEVIKPFEEKYMKKIPIIIGGGIFDGKDIINAIKLGASGVQMGTRFIGTKECDAHINYKKMFLKAKKEDITIVASPVGMPGRAIKNEFVQSINKSKRIINHCYNCLKPCNPKTTPYCISEALINAVVGNVKDGLIFSGSNGYRINEIISVKQLINTLIKEISEIKEC